MRLLPPLLSHLALALVMLAAPAPRPDDEIAGLLAEWKAEYGSGWWPWGLSALDYDGDGQMDLLITQHNGGSRVLRNDGGHFAWADVGSALGGTFRPVVWDFDGDGRPDLLFRDSGANTAFVNTGGKFAPLGFAYSTGNLPVKEHGAWGFSHDFGKWLWTGSTFEAVEYTHPAFSKLPPAVAQFLADEWQKPANKYLQVWILEYDLNGDGLLDTIVCGFGYYGGSIFGRYLLAGPDGSLGDASALLGLPLDGTPVYAGPEGIVVTGRGLYVPSGRRWKLQPDDVTNFTKEIGVWPHAVYPVPGGLVVSNQRGGQTEIYAQTGPGQYAVVESLASWDGECIAVCPEFVAVGSEDTVQIFWGPNP